MEIRKKWHKLWSKPDPMYLQHARLLDRSVDGVRRSRGGSRSNIQAEKQASSEGSSVVADGCLCKWTLDKNGKLRRSFIKTGSIKSNKSNKKLLNLDTKI